MPIPYVKIDFANGAIGTLAPEVDGVVGVIAMGMPTSKLAADVAAVCYSLEDAETTHDVNETDNPALYNFLKRFYEEAGNGAECWFVIVSNMVTLGDMFETSGLMLCNTSKGKIRGLFALFAPDSTYTPTIVEGVDGQVWTGLTKAQTLADAQTADKFAPIVCFIWANGFSGNAGVIRDLRTGLNNRVALIIADDVNSCANVLGRFAKNQVHIHIGKVLDGKLKTDTWKIAGKDSENYLSLNVLNDKGYLFARTFTGKDGYFIADDNLATGYQDDYCYLTRRRTIDKAYRITYTTMVNFINQEVPINADGTIQHLFIKGWETTLQSAIERQMQGELSATDTDSGVQVYINPAQNVVATGRIEVAVKVRPFGYAKYIEVKLGFTVSSN